jgi:hypothetical protein
VEVDADVVEVRFGCGLFTVSHPLPLLLLQLPELSFL